MAEREAVVVAVERDGLRLRPAPQACSGCDSGCGGRCDLFRTDLSGELRLPAPRGQSFASGDRVLLSLDDAQLRRAAFAGYGRALAGLVLGAGAGHGLAIATGWPADPLTLAGLVGGTCIALLRSKRVALEPRLRLVPSGPDPISEERTSP